MGDRHPPAFVRDLTTGSLLVDTTDPFPSAVIANQTLSPTTLPSLVTPILTVTEVIISQSAEPSGTTVPLHPQSGIGAIAGGIVGGVVLFAVVAIVLSVRYRRARFRGNRNSDSGVLGKAVSISPVHCERR